MANIALITNNVLSDSGTAITSLVSGSGTANYLSKFTGSTALGNSLIYDDGTFVGIGTATPSYKLDVNGTGRFTGTTNQITAYYDASNYLQLQHNSISVANTALLFNVNSAERMRLLSTGNLLIGTTTDSGHKLQVNGTALFYGSPTISVSNLPQLTFNDTLISHNWVIRSNGSNLWFIENGNNRVWIGGTNSGYAGNVGIGVLNTSYKLDVNGTTRFQGASIVTGSVTASSSLAQGAYFNNTLVASANNDVLVGLDVAPTFTNGAFTGVVNYGIRTSGDIAFASSANRYLTMQSPSTSGNGGNIIIQSAAANTSGTGGNLYLYVGGGAGGPGPGKIYIGNNNGWDVAYVTGILTVSSTGPNTGDVLRVSGGGRNALTIAWDNLTPFMSYSLVSGRQSRFLNSSSYYFDNNFLIGTTTDGGYKLNVNGNGNFILGNSGYIRLQSGSGQRHGYIQSAFSNFLFSNNIYYDGSNWRYDQNGYGAQIQTETLSVGVIAFNTFASGTAGNVATIIESMRIVNNGNILMGTTTDSGYKLDVNGTSRFTNSISLTGSNRYIGTNASNLSIYITGGSSYLDGAYFNLTGNTYGASPGAGSAEFVIRTNSDSKFALFGYNGSSWSRYMTLFGPTGNLNIGSGTTDSGYKLRIEGNTYNDGEIISVGNITTNASAYVNANAQGYNLIVYPNTTSGPNNLYSGGQVQANIYTSSNLNAVTVVPSTSQVVMAWYPSTTQGVFIDYTLWIYGGANAMRSGTFMVVNDSSGNVQYTDIATPDLNASTALATLAAANNGGVMEVTLTNGSGNVVFINTVTRYIPTMV